MATNRNLLKEAIADAKAVKEMAIANAKAALEEAFTPQLKTMLSAKLQEMELEEEKEEMKEEDVEEVGFGDNDSLNTMAEEKEDDMMEVDLEELLAELEEEEKMELNEEEMEDESRAERADVDKYEYEKGKEAGEENEMEGEPLDLEDMTDEDLKKFIEDVISDMVETGELEAGEGAEEEEGEDVDVDVDVDVEDEEEVDLAELLKEIEDMEEDMKYEEPVDEAKEDLDEAEDLDKAEIKAELMKIKDAAKEEGKLNEGLLTEAFNPFDPDVLTQVMGILAMKSVIPAASILFLGKWIASVTAIGGAVGFAAKKLIKFAKKLIAKAKGNKATADLKEAYETIETLQKELKEINLLNAKLLYTNKIFKSKNLNESQKVKVLGSFDNATNVKETKLVYNTLNEGIKVKKPSIEKTLGRASKSTNVPKTVKKPIVESNDAYLRMQKLAGLIK
jgi:hypothetical protein